MLIRKATDGDAAAVCRVCREAIIRSCVADHHNDSAITALWTANKTPDRALGWIRDESGFFVVAEVAGEVAGVSMVKEDGYVALCYVLPEQQGKGLGRGLLEAVEAQARGWGLSELHLESTETALLFYAASGYFRFGEPFITMGMWAYPMKKVLADSSSVAAHKPLYSM